MPQPEIVDVLGSADPRRAFADAHRAGRLIGLTTSGTAGRPRTVVRTTRSWADSFPYVADLLGLGPGSRVWVPGPLTATMNLFAAVHAAWGARYWWTGHGRPPRPPDAISAAARARDRARRAGRAPRADGW